MHFSFSDLEKLFNNQKHLSYFFVAAHPHLGRVTKTPNLNSNAEKSWPKKRRRPTTESSTTWTSRLPSKPTERRKPNDSKSWAKRRAKVNPWWPEEWNFCWKRFVHRNRNCLNKMYYKTCVFSYFWEVVKTFPLYNGKLNTGHLSSRNILIQDQVFAIQMSGNSLVFIVYIILGDV